MTLTKDHGYRLQHFPISSRQSKVETLLNIAAQHTRKMISQHYVNSSPKCGGVNVDPINLSDEPKSQCVLHSKPQDGRCEHDGWGGHGSCKQAVVHHGLSPHASIIK